MGVYRPFRPYFRIVTVWALGALGNVWRQSPSRYFLPPHQDHPPHIPEPFALIEVRDAQSLFIDRYSLESLIHIGLVNPFLL